MQIPIIPFRGQKKPWGSIPRINLAHPLAAGLVFYGYDIGGPFINLVNGGISSIVSGTIPSRANSPIGTGIKLANAGATLKMPVVANQTGNVTPKFSMGCGFYPTAAPGSTVAIMFGLGDASNNTAMALYQQSATVIGYGWANTLGDTATVVSMTSGFHTAVGVSIANTTAQDYFDGKLVASTATTTNFAGTASQFIFNGGSLGTLADNTFNGFCYWGGFWNRALTAAENLLLHI